MSILKWSDLKDHCVHHKNGGLIDLGFVCYFLFFFFVPFPSFAWYYTFVVGLKDTVLLDSQTKASISTNQKGQKILFTVVHLEDINIKPARSLFSDPRHMIDTLQKILRRIVELLQASQQAYRYRILNGKLF